VEKTLRLESADALPHFSTAAATTKLTEVCWGEGTGRKNSQTACRKTWVEKWFSPNRGIYQDQHARIIIMARRKISN
jgi:hypothetical protein